MFLNYIYIVLQYFIANGVGKDVTGTFSLKMPTEVNEPGALVRSFWTKIEITCTLRVMWAPGFVAGAAFDATLAPIRCLALPGYKMVQ